MPGFPLRSTALLLLLISAHGHAAELFNNSKADAAQLSALGDRLFREARFDDAEAAWSQALDLDKRNVGGHLGLGKVAALRSDLRQATSHFSAAYQLAPRDPNAILAFAEVMEDPQARQTLLRNYLVLARDARAEDVAARLRVAQQLGSTRVSALASPLQPYRIPLDKLRADGLILRARINGGRELKLLLDTGADGIVLNASAAKNLALENLADAALFGFGSAAPAAAHIARAASFETSGLRLTDLLLNTGETDFSRQADGVIGLNVFQDFLIRLDSPARTLDLTPLPDGPPQPCGDCLRAYRLGKLVLVRGRINGQTDGYFVLDSGSPFTMISRKLVSQEGRPAIFQGAQGTQHVDVPSAPLALQFGAQHLIGFRYATFDTGELSARNGVEIAGAIGYSLLCDLTLTMNYRDGLLKLGKHARE